MQDYIFWRRPPTKFARELDTQYLRCLELPRRINKCIDRIRTTNTNDDSSETTGIWRVAVGA
jgi:hypothetical protein